MDGYRFARARFALELGRFQEAAEIHDLIFSHGGQKYLPPGIGANLAVERIMLDRMCRRPIGDVNAAHADADTPIARAVLDVLFGSIDWAEAERRTDGKSGAEAMLYYRALWELARGEHDPAQAHFRQFVDGHPLASQGATARGILVWYAGQTPKGLASLPRATAAPPPAAVSRPADF
jgi:hypothetical protein